MQFDITLLSNIIKFFNEAFEWSTGIKVSKVYLLLFKKTWLTVNSYILDTPIKTVSFSRVNASFSIENGKNFVLASEF